MKLRILLSIPVMMLAACAAPRTSVVTDDQAGKVRFHVEPGSATVIVDGSPMGKAREYDGTSAVLKLPAGTHVIRLEAEGREAYEQKVYLSDSEELIDIRMKEKP